jgi:hypothetical protein
MKERPRRAPDASATESTAASQHLEGGDVGSADSPRPAVAPRISEKPRISSKPDGEVETAAFDA